MIGIGQIPTERNSQSGMVSAELNPVGTRGRSGKPRMIWCHLFSKTCRLHMRCKLFDVEDFDKIQPDIFDMLLILHSAGMSLHDKAGRTPFLLDQSEAVGVHEDNLNTG